MLNRKSAASLIAILCLSASVIACSSKPASEEGANEAAAPQVTDGKAVDPITLPQLAYDYSFGLSAPDSRLNAMMEGHQEACTVAGPAVCQVLSLDTQSGQREAASHTLVLRATPQWIGVFRKALANELKASGGRIEQQSIATEDLSLDLIDREAHISNQTALRDNLQATLRTHTGKMSEVVELKQELASVQSEIDAARTAVAVMKKRVAMSKLTLTYVPASAASSRGTFAPLANALGDIGPNFVSALTVLIVVFSYLAPLALAVAPVVWWLRQRRKVHPVVSPE